ncbi:DUF1801 domain-containing protein [Massilia sp. W12]|uniref:DUF1801 domain-containing protein n=1 Tax=Massilia sp. W12 TaxID=3126507 RepID=UPI0030D53193
MPTAKVKQSVPALLDDIRLLKPQIYEIVEAVRALAQASLENLSEEVKYGGILFADGVQFGGVFAYTAHVSVEFGHGAKIADPYGFLEGAGKGRRHIKLHTLAQIEEKKLAEYLLLALRAAQQG